ncbi:hypothetical protein [Pyruvatibacter sp.]|uniref:hypothetical protein n=1 Tax=Pyruvatibacter sp. TaxID=1981328 RepID=UPI003263319A
MVSKEFKECLVDVYQGELAGEAVMEVMLGAAETPKQTYILGSLLQLETEGKALIRPTLVKCGLSILDTAGDMSEGEAAIREMNSLPWVERFTAIRDVTRAQYLPRYEELSTLVTVEEDRDAATLAAFMGDHERAVISMAERVIAGAPDPAGPVVDLLRFPLPKPVS